MTKRHIQPKLQELVKERAQGCCEYCVSPESRATQRHSNEHIVPESAGGMTTAKNLALACQGLQQQEVQQNPRA